MVIPADDQALTVLAEHYDEFNNLTHVASPPPGITDLVLNKASTLQIAQKCGIRVPTTSSVSNSGELFGNCADLPFPWVLKPSRKEVRTEEVKSYVLESPAAVKAAFRAAQAFHPPMLLQEYCAGEGVGVEILMHNGEPWAIFQHRRLKEFPRNGGMSVTAIAEQPSPNLVEKSISLLRALRWQGPAMVEFRVNPDDGKAAFMEVNGRYWGTIGLAIRAGMNFPLYHWQLLHGEEPSVPHQYAVGTLWRWPAGHVLRLHSLLRASRHSSAARSELRQTLLRFLGPSSVQVPEGLPFQTDMISSFLEVLDILKLLCTCDAKEFLERFSQRALRGSSQR